MDSETYLKYPDLPCGVAPRPDTCFHVDPYRSVGEQMVFAVVHVNHDVCCAGAFSGHLNIAAFLSYRRRDFAVGGGDLHRRGLASGQLYADLVFSADRHRIALCVKCNGIADARNRVIAEMLGRKDEEAVLHSGIHVGERAGTFLKAEDVRYTVHPRRNRNFHGYFSAESGNWVSVLVQQFDIIKDRCSDDI